MRCNLSILMVLVCALSGLPQAHAQQNYANDIRRSGDSARLPTLPMEPGRLEVYFINIKDNDVVRSPFRLLFGLSGFGVAPAGVKKEGTGHHHLLIDSTLPLDLSKPIAFSDKYRHFGGGQTETVLTLEPGRHTLQLLFADADHRPQHKTKSGSVIVLHSKRISILVEKSK